MDRSRSIRSSKKLSRRSSSKPTRDSKAHKQLIMERRILLGCTCLVGLSICIWATAIGTNYWLQATTNKTIVVPGSRLPDGTKIFHGAHMGLFHACAYGVICAANQTVIQSYYDCLPTETFLEEMRKHRARPWETSNEKRLVAYSRTDISFGIISMFVMVMGLFFSIYTFNNPRYTFKRLAAGIHFISCACVMVVIQVMLSSKEAGSKSDTWVFPQDVIPQTGYSLILGWFVFISNLFSSCAFLLFSRKRKRSQVPDDDFAMADEPTIIGR